MIWDVLVAGGGPAGLSAAIAAASQGLSVLVCERRRGPLDKACGEGLMPAGARALAGLGVDVPEAGTFVGIRYVQEDGSEANGRFPPGREGMGIRRLSLQLALWERATALGVELRSESMVRAFTVTPGAVTADTDSGTVSARILVAADGLASPIRHQAGLDGGFGKGRRFGIRRHYLVESPGDRVEVHFGGPGVEAYLTPVGSDRMGLAFLWDERRLGPTHFDALLRKFPLLAERLEGAAPLSEVRGAGPLHRKASRRTSDRLVLIGDAAGYVDALTGEGLSLAFSAAMDLGALLPLALKQGATRRSLTSFERRSALRYANYAMLAHSLLMLSRHPGLRRRVIDGLGRSPRLFDGILGLIA